MSVPLGVKLIIGPKFLVVNEAKLKAQNTWNTHIDELRKQQPACTSNVYGSVDVVATNKIEDLKHPCSFFQDLSERRSIINKLSSTN